MAEPSTLVLVSADPTCPGRWRSALEALGWSVRLATDATLALGLLQQLPRPQLALIAADLPGMGARPLITAAGCPCALIDGLLPGLPSLASPPSAAALAALLSAPPAATLPELDTDMLARLRQMNPATLATLLRVLRDSLPKRQTDLAAAWAAGDLSALWRLAHALRGSAAMLGATRLSQAAGAVESPARAGNAAAAQAARADLDAAFLSTSAALDRQLAS